MRLVSAIITTHNRLELLKRAIKSVREQTYPNIELIVVDDASEDGTKEYCETQNFRFIHVPKEESRGGNHARNLGVMAAQGEYVAFLDDDDYWLPEKTAKQVALIESMDCELVHCGRRLEIVNAGRTEYRDTLPNPRHWGDMSRKILLAICITTTNILVKKQALLDAGLFDESLRFWQEYELTIRLAQRKPFYFVNEPLTVYRLDIGDKGRLTNRYFEWKKAVRYIHQKHAALYAKLSPVEKLLVQYLVWNDAQKRCKASHLHLRCLGYFALRFPIRAARKLRTLLLSLVID